MISVEQLATEDPLEFKVRVSEGGGETNHHVTLSRADYEELSGKKVGPEGLVEASFRFLLDREPKESILKNFDIQVISRYFPDYPRKVRSYLSA